MAGIPLIYEERTGSHPLVQAFWRAEARGGAYGVPPDACWDIIWTSSGGKTDIVLAGTMTATHTVEFPAGTRFLGVRFKTGVRLQGMDPARTIDQDIALASRSARRFWLDGIPFDLPNYENIDGFVSKLERHKLISRDEIVRKVMEGESALLSKRSVQRHFARHVGLPWAFIRQIQRAEQAAAWLAAGIAPSQVAATAGFADQAHMTRELKRLFRLTPGQIRTRT